MFRNCVNYNWSGPTNLGGLQINVINNTYRPGPWNTIKNFSPTMLIQLNDNSPKWIIYL